MGALLLNPADNLSHHVIFLLFSETNENVDINRKPTSGKREVVVPPTPSKVLFSPGLRTDPAGIHQQQQNTFDEEDDEESLNGDHVHEEGTPTTPLAPDHHHAHEAEAAHKLEDEAQQEEDDSDEFNPYQFIAHLPAHSSVCIVDKICLPPLVHANGAKKQELPTLALDLDETLVHCTVEPIAKPDLVFPVK